MNDSIDNDVLTALASHYRELAAPRGDEAHAHISDLAAPCDRATWHRRKGDKPSPINATLAAKFKMGKDVEADVIAALRKLYGTSRIREDYRVVWDPTDDSWDVQPESGRSVGTTELIGHIDAVLIDETSIPIRVFEAKSTSFLRGQVPLLPSEWYEEQVIAYATAVKVDDATIVVQCRESGKSTQYDLIVTDERREWARERALEVLDVTDPKSEPPAAVPRYKWACRNCRFAQCPSNPEYRATLRVVS